MQFYKVDVLSLHVIVLSRNVSISISRSAYHETCRELLNHMLWMMFDGVCWHQVSVAPRGNPTLSTQMTRSEPDYV